jgi:Family of unknown function (DUF6519)
MHADVSKISFRPEKDFSGVVAQQGRVQLDAEFNEQVAIQSHLARTFATDLIGRHGGPRSGTGFAIGYRTPDNEPADLTIGGGHYYVDGILADATKPPAGVPVPDSGEAPPPPADQWTYWTQPHGFLDPDVSADQLPAPPFLAYLRVAERFVTAVEDPDLRESALGITLPDTAGRLRVVWQVRALPAADLHLEGDPTPDNLRTAFDTWRDGQQATASRLAFGTQRPPQADDDPCVVHPDARFRGENSLYRVEIHTGGDAKAATFTWSRDNGSVVFPIASAHGEWVTLAAFGRDDKLDLHVGDVVEVVDDAVTGRGTVHALPRVVELDLPGRRVRLSAEPAAVGGHPYLRRWDHGVASRTAKDGAISVTEGRWLDLEDGVQIWFAAGGTYRSGEYWVAAARTLTGSVEWPLDEHGTPLLLGPAGPRYHVAPLAWIGADRHPTDLRMVFGPLAVPIDQAASGRGGGGGACGRAPPRRGGGGNFGHRNPLRLGARVGTGDPDAEHARVVRGADLLGGHLGGQGERAPEGAVAHLTQPALPVLALVAALTADHEPAPVDLDRDVLLNVQTGQLNADHRVLAVPADLGGRAELRLLRAERGPDQGVELRERVAPGPQRQSTHPDLLIAGGLSALHDLSRIDSIPAGGAGRGRGGRGGHGGHGGHGGRGDAQDRVEQAGEVPAQLVVA